MPDYTICPHCMEAEIDGPCECVEVREPCKWRWKPPHTIAEFCKHPLVIHHKKRAGNNFGEPLDGFYFSATCDGCPCYEPAQGRIPDTTEKVLPCRTVWVAYTNTDLSEGRGVDVPIAYCAIEATAKRLALRQYVQGHDGPVRAMEVVRINGEWRSLGGAIDVVDPIDEDIAARGNEPAQVADTEECCVWELRAVPRSLCAYGDQAYEYFTSCETWLPSATGMNKCDCGKPIKIAPQKRGHDYP